MRIKMREIRGSKRRRVKIQKIIKTREGKKERKRGTKREADNVVYDVININITIMKEGRTKREEHFKRSSIFAKIHIGRRIEIEK